MDEPTKRNWTMITTFVAIAAAFIGALLLYLGEFDKERGKMMGRLPMIDSLLNAREKRLEDTIRRVEKLESKIMEKP